MSSAKSCYDEWWVRWQARQDTKKKGKAEGLNLVYDEKP